MKLFKTLLCTIICISFSNSSYATPLVSNLINPTKYVLGYEKEITDLSNRLALYNVAGLVGFSGMGKTELAKKYAYNSQDKYDLIWFFDSNIDLTEQFINLSKKINESSLCAPNKCNLSEDVSKAKQDVLGFLAPKGNWLLVFDNLHVNQNTKIMDIIEWQHNGSVILCSQDAKDLPNAIHLPYLSDNDATNVANIILENKTSEVVKELVKAAKGYPILLVQGAMYLNENKHMTVADYEKIISASNDKMRSHMEIVLRQLSDTAKDLLYKISVINNQQFSRKLLEHIMSKESLYKDLDNIIRFGLINIIYSDKDTQIFEMHDAIKESILKIMGVKEVKKTLISLVESINKLMPKTRRKTNAILSQDKTLQSNLEILLNNVEKYEIDIYKNMGLHKNLMKAYLSLYDYYNCKKMADWLTKRQDKFDALLTSLLMNDQEKAVYSEYLALIGTYNDYANSNFVDAIAYLKKAAELIKNNNRYPELQFYIYYHLAQVYVYGGDVKNGEKNFTILDEIAATNPKLSLDGWFTKSKMYLLQGKYDEAQSALTKYFEASPDVPDNGVYKAPAYTLRAEILNYMGKFQEAYAVAKKTYDQQKINIKGDHEIHSRVLIQLAWAELGLGMKQAALEHIKESVRIFINDDEVIWDYNTDLAAAYVVQGNIAAAIGKDNKMVMDSYGNASKIYSNRYADNLFLVDDIKCFYFDASENLCKISNNKSVLEKIIYTEYRDKIIEHWPNDQKTKEILQIEKEHNCRVLPNQ